MSKNISAKAKNMAGASKSSKLTHSTFLKLSASIVKSILELMISINLDNAIEPSDAV